MEKRALCQTESISSLFELAKAFSESELTMSENKDLTKMSNKFLIAGTVVICIGIIILALAFYLGPNILDAIICFLQITASIIISLVVVLVTCVVIPVFMYNYMNTLNRCKNMITKCGIIIATVIIIVLIPLLIQQLVYLANTEGAQIAENSIVPITATIYFCAGLSFIVGVLCNKKT